LCNAPAAKDHHLCLVNLTSLLTRTSMKTLRSVNLLTFTLFVAGAWVTDRTSVWYTTTQLPNVPTIPRFVFADQNAPATYNVPQAASNGPEGDIETWKDKHAPQMWATATATLYKGETFHLHFSVPNDPFLGLIDPRGHFFYLVFPAETAVGALTPLVESKQFTVLQTLAINTGSLQADPYTYGVYENRPVFTVSGTYTFILGENLHVDDLGLLEKVAVRYIHTQRPVRVSSSTAMH